MRFPYKRSVGQDLRDLFGIQRLDAQARTLGRSSLREGEGAVRLLSADGTTALAIFGDLPGGGSGVGVPVGGTMRSVATVFGEQAATISTQAGQISGLLTATGAQAARLTTLEAFKAYADNQITNLLGNATTTNARLNAVEGTTSSLSTTVGSLVTQVGALASSGGSIASRMSAAETKNTAQDAELAQLRARATDLEQKYEALKRRLDQGGIPP